MKPTTPSKTKPDVRRLHCNVLSHIQHHGSCQNLPELQSPTLAQQQDLHQQFEVRFRHSDCHELCQQVAGKSATTELKHSSSAGSWEETAKGSGNDTKAGTGQDQGDRGASSKCRVMLPFSARRASATVCSSCDRTLSTEAGTWLRLLKQSQLPVGKHGKTLKALTTFSTSAVWQQSLECLHINLQVAVLLTLNSFFPNP